MTAAVTAAAASRTAADKAAKATTLQDANEQKDEAENQKDKAESQLNKVKQIADNVAAAAAAAAAAAVAALQQALVSVPSDSDGAGLLQQINAELANLPPAGLV